MQHRFRDFENARQPASAAGQHNAAHAELEHSCVPQVVTQHFEQFAGARLEDFSHHALRNQPGRPVPDRGNFDFVSFRDQSHNGIAIQPLDFLRLGDRSAEAHREIAGKVISADRNHSGVSDCTFLKNDDAGGSGAQVGEAYAQFPLVGS